MRKRLLVVGVCLAPFLDGCGKPIGGPVGSEASQADGGQTVNLDRGSDGGAPDGRVGADGGDAVADNASSPGHQDSDSASDGDTSAPGDGGTMPPAPPPPTAGMVVFPLGDGHWHRLAEQGGALEDLAVGLDKISRGTDGYVNPSPDGTFLVVQSSRFGCASGSCLSRFYWDLSAGEPILAAGHVVSTSDGRAVIASGGNRIVYPARGGPHAVDLWVINRNPDNGWSAPLLLTGASPYPQHHDTAISRDGGKVAFDCGPSPYQAPATSICEVNTDGTGFHKIVDPVDGPGGSQANTTHHPDYAPDGSMIFEADWESEQVWRLAPGGGPVKVSPASQTNDNSPCVFADGKIASLWLPNATHDIKVMDPSGTSSAMILSGNDVVDIGMGCGH